MSSTDTKLPWVVCPECEGAGQWDVGPLPAKSSAQIDPEYRQVICRECDGEGCVDAPATPWLPIGQAPKNRPVDLWVENNDGTGYRAVNAFWRELSPSDWQWAVENFNAYGESNGLAPVAHSRVERRKTITHFTLVTEPCHEAQS